MLFNTKPNQNGIVARLFAVPGTTGRAPGPGLDVRELNMIRLGEFFGGYHTGDLTVHAAERDHFST